MLGCGGGGSGMSRMQAYSLPSLRGMVPPLSCPVIDGLAIAPPVFICLPYTSACLAGVARLRLQAYNKHMHFFHYRTQSGASYVSSMR